MLPLRDPHLAVLTFTGAGGGHWLRSVCAGSETRAA